MGVGADGTRRTARNPEECPSSAWPFPGTAVPGGSGLAEGELVQRQVDFRELHTLLPWPWVTWSGTKAPHPPLSGEGFRESSTCARGGKVAMEQVHIASLPPKEEANQGIDEEERRQAADGPCINRRVPDDGTTKCACR